MSDCTNLSKENLNLILALSWEIEHKVNRTFLTRADLPVGVIIIDWEREAIIYSHKKSLDIESRIQSYSSEENFNAIRLLEAESNAISDIIRRMCCHEDLNNLFQALDDLRKRNGSPTSIFAFAGRGLSGALEYHYALIRFNETTGFQAHTELNEAILLLESSKRMLDEIGLKRAKNKISFIVGNPGIYHQVIEIARLRDGIGFSWDENATFLSPGQIGIYGDDAEYSSFNCIDPSCGFRSYPESWQLGFHGGFVAACHRAWQAHKDDHPHCTSPLNF